ncbi:flavin reductase family protein [Bosea sp. (in: a-proteobacteria)]|jgi:flavin reductase (DIM6/NTAB) family NADH-FMN oxidoreductase RutF|uniref:flavin reductase family protein n=1 Tax=Bosea sp. (in: a-proteobacteria) TaxID=1871050 RepID=UPI002DDCE60E|nr:flavin reductase family protein [Bosea sp. (in: a-proteobacteria)]HEV2508420.1 flavin reductase family protein [Bosea sp. (in: a-proteobacteria)]
MSFSAREFRDALGLFPTGVAIITAKTSDGELLGATVSSFNSVSLEPPLVLFSVGRNARAFEHWNSVEHYAVNLLGEGQSELSTRFAKPMTDKWQGITPIEGAAGQPLLPDAMAWFECRNHARHDGGDHLILIGEVTRFSLAMTPRPRPLVFFRGRYRQLDAEHLIETPPGVEHLLHGW